MIITVVCMASIAIATNKTKQKLYIFKLITITSIWKSNRISLQQSDIRIFNAQCRHLFYFNSKVKWISTDHTWPPHRLLYLLITAYFLFAVNIRPQNIPRKLISTYFCKKQLEITDCWQHSSWCLKDNYVEARYTGYFPLKWRGLFAF